MARNELTKNARQLSEQALNTYFNEYKQAEIAEKMGCDPSTVCRFIANEEYVKTLNWLSAMGFELYLKSDVVPVKREHLVMFEHAIQRGSGGR